MSVMLNFIVRCLVQRVCEYHACACVFLCPCGRVIAPTLAGYVYTNMGYEAVPLFSMAFTMMSFLWLRLASFLSANAGEAKAKLAQSSVRFFTRAYKVARTSI